MARRGKRTFKQNDLERGIKVATGFGLQIERIRITQDAAEIIIGAGKADDAKESENNNDEVEKWLAKHAHQS